MAEWAKVDVGFLRHPQVCALRPLDRLAYLALILYAMEHETDGLVPTTSIDACGVKPAQIEAMVAAGLVKQVAAGWTIDGFKRNQQTRAEMEEHRAQNAARQKAYRVRHKESP